MNIQGVDIQGVAIKGYTAPALRSLLSASGQTAYDAAATDSFFSVSAADYAAAAAGISTVSKYGLNDTNVAEAAGGWSSNYAQAFPSTIGTIPAGEYIFGFQARSSSIGTVTPLIATTFRGTYDPIANSPATTNGRTYYLRKASTATAAVSYIGIVYSTVSPLTSTTFTTATGAAASYDGAAPYAGPWTLWNGAGLLIFQTLSTPTKQW